jgi:prepilin-type processing-associated H-X9-DG protein
MTTAPSRKSGLATTSLVLGILAIFCLGPLTGIAAIVLGLKAKRSSPSSLATAGIVTGAAGSFLAVIGWIFVALVAIPSFARAKEIATRTQDAAHLRLIANALLIYATENMDRFPPSLAAAAENVRDPHFFVSRNTTTTPPVYTLPVTDWHTLVPGFDAHTDFIYVGAGMRSSVEPDVILAYSKDIYDHQGRNILFTDAHVEFVPAADLSRVFAKSNAARARRNLSPITLDGPPPQAAARPYMPPLEPPLPAARPHPILPTPSSGSFPTGSSPQDAITAITGDDSAQRHAALLYIRGMSRYWDPADKAKIAAVLRQQLKQPNDRRFVIEALPLYPDPENIPALIDYLDTTPSGDIAEVTDRDLVMRQLGRLKDPRAAEHIAKYLTSRSRAIAADALTTLGPSAEDAVLPYLQSTDPLAQREACNILKSIGASKSLTSLQPLAASSNAGIKRAAQTAIDAINARNK